jgi:hypothetical protein
MREQHLQVEAEQQAQALMRQHRSDILKHPPTVLNIYIYIHIYIYIYISLCVHINKLYVYIHT